MPLRFWLVASADGLYTVHSDADLEFSIEEPAVRYEGISELQEPIRKRSLSLAVPAAGSLSQFGSR